MKQNKFVLIYLNYRYHLHYMKTNLNSMNIYKLNKNTNERKNK